MKADLPKYPTYKPSENAWIGDLPEKWEAWRLRFIAPLQGGYAFPASEFSFEGIPVVRMNNLKRGRIDFTDAACVLDGPKRFALKPNDLLLGMSGSIGDTGSLGNYAEVTESDVPSFLNQRVGRFIISESLIRDFVKYLIQSRLFSEPLLLDVTGTAQFNISSNQVGNIRVPLPEKTEQQSIVTFLNQETAKIDQLMEVRRKQVERLYEQRIAVISHAVTKGLDQNAKLKVSGIKWLDKIPMDWEVMPLWTRARLIVSNVDKKSVPGEQSVRLCNYLDVYKNDHINGGLAFMEATATRAEIAKFSLRLNDVIITKDSEDPNDIAVPAIVTESVPSLVCGYHLAILRALPRLLPAYLFHLFQTVYMRSYFATKAQGVTRFGLSQNDITRCPVPAPPIPAQEAIVRHIDRETVKLDRLVTQYNKEIELLSEYRASLISHAVTGKIDVRGLVTTTHPKAA